MVAPVAAVQRVADTGEASDRLPPHGEATGRISRVETEPPAPTAERAEGDEAERAKELEKIADHVYRTIRRKLLVERERTRGRV